MRNKATTSTGSNKYRTANVKEVTEIPTKHFSTICLSTPQLTEPVDTPEDARASLNLITLFEIDPGREILGAELEKLETKLGRDYDDNEEDIIPMDLDIVEWNDEAYKPQDMVHPYVITGLGELNEL